MANKTFSTRIKNKRDTSSNWTSKDPLLLNGELIIVDTANGETRFKIGDGTKKYSQLPFQDEVIRNLFDSIPVRYDKAQTLTENQKSTARSNLGIDPLVGNTAAITSAQVKEAVLAGRPVVITYTDTTFGDLTFTNFAYSVEQNVVVSNMATKYNDDMILADLIGLSNWQLVIKTLATEDTIEELSAGIANNYVSYGTSQPLTDDQKARARKNINVPSPADAVYTVTASSTDGVAYTATVPGIDSLTAGASFIMVPNKTSASQEPTLNVNGLGAKKIRRRLNNLVTVTSKGYSNTWISVNKPFSLIYDGTYWIVEGMEQPVGADMYGTVPMATSDARGNVITDTYATIAMLQSMLPKVTTINLVTGWGGNSSPYYQDVTLSCCTETSVVDLQPTPTQLASWQDEGLAFTTQSGDGIVRVYVAGGKPTSAISVQVKVQEVVEV